MAACPVDVTPLSYSRHRPLALTQRRLEANRRNAASSTGPRTADGKARVARNAIKHGFFVAQERWTPGQQRDFEATLEGLREDFRPEGMLEETCVRTIAESYVRMAAALRYENIAALKEHRRRNRELDEHIARAKPIEAAQLKAEREDLRRAGLWKPTIPAEREANAIIRYLGRIDRTIGEAMSQLKALKNLKIDEVSWSGNPQKRCETTSSRVPRLGEGPPPAPTGLTKVQKQTHYSAAPNSGPEARRRTYAQRFEASTLDTKAQKQTHFVATAGDGSEIPERSGMLHPAQHENAKTNPLSSMFPGNRHQRRRAKALERRR
jgi:hypothetical protein